MSKKKFRGLIEEIDHLQKRLDLLQMRRPAQFPKWTRKDQISLMSLLEILKQENMLPDVPIVEDEE